MEAEAKNPLDSLHYRFLLSLIALVLRLLAWSWRPRYVGNAKAFRVNRPDPANPIVMPFWHNRILALTGLYRGKPICVMVSKHRDGEIIARIAGKLGFTFVRGSTSREGLRALMEIVRVVKGGTDVGITPDGPRGPREAFQVGAILLAMKSRRPIVLITVGARRAWRTKSWDAHLIPKPFTRVVVVLDEEIFIPDDPKLDVEALRVALEDRLRKLTARAEALAAGEADPGMAAFDLTLLLPHHQPSHD